ncbi:tetratricopeptide repeat protein [Nitrospinota bacterium]
MVSRISRSGTPTSPRAHIPWLLGHAYMLTGKKKDAIEQFKNSIAINPNFLPAHAYLAFMYSEAGKTEEARSHLAEVTRISPGATAENLRGRLPYKDGAITERIITALKRVEG